ncbi:hypothetical protein [Amycolatopsis acidicola]|uniref:hypothetical protein n=1 Tax=Amycolatopsis acidicola TaxID=2596893 RepID=UPI00140C6C2C|nr:hypothetical protein [Amycolatopsis acidicola]
MTVRIGNVALADSRLDRGERIPAARMRSVALSIARRRRHVWWYHFGFGEPRPR